MVVRLLILVSMWESLKVSFTLAIKRTERFGSAREVILKAFDFERIKAVAMFG